MEAQSCISRLSHMIFSCVICFFSVPSNNIINAYILIKSSDSELLGDLYTIIPLSFDELEVTVICTGVARLTQIILIAVEIVYSFGCVCFSLHGVRRIKSVWVFSCANKIMCYYLDKQISYFPVTYRLQKEQLYCYDVELWFISLLK